MDENGKINGMPPVFNDALAFVYSKIQICKFQTLVDVTSEFYLEEELKEAREVIYNLIDPSGRRKLPRLRRRPDIAYGIVIQLSEHYKELNCFF